MTPKDYKSWGSPVTDPQELLVLLAVERLIVQVGKNRGALAPAETLSRMTRLSLSTVKRRLGSLRDSGLLVVTNTRVGNFYSLPESG